MEEVPNIPIGIMLEPYIKQATVLKKPKYNTIDFDYYVGIARHQKLSLNDAILVVDSLGKIYFNDQIFVNSAEIPLFLIISRFIDAKAMQEFFIKFINIGFGIIYSKLPPKSIVPIRETISKEETDQKKMLLYYKNLVFKLVEKVIILKNEEINTEIKRALLVAHTEAKNITGTSMKAIKILLSLLGDANMLISNYESSHMIIDVIRKESSIMSPKSLSNISDNKGTVSIVSKAPRSRAFSDIEKVRKMRQDKETREKSQSEFRRAAEEKQRQNLQRMLEQRKVFHGIDNSSVSSQTIFGKEMISTIDMPLFLIEEETDNEQEIIKTLIKKNKKIFKIFFNHYSSTGYKKEKIKKGSFEVLHEKKAFISEGEIIKMLRDQKINNSLISTEDIKRVISWFLLKNKTNHVDYESFCQMVYYLSYFIYSQKGHVIGHCPVGITLIMIMNQFKSSASSLVPADYYDGNYFGIGDKDVIKMLNTRIIQNPDLVLPEGYKKVKGKDVSITFEIPEFFPVSYKVSLAILDDIFVSALKVHLLRPIVKIIPVTYVSGILTKPLLEKEDKFKLIPKLGVPNNKASYKVQPLPGYLNFSPGIKLEVARLTGKYSNDLILECARMLDDLCYTVENNSFNIISKNPKPPGSIPNKILQQKHYEIMEELSEKKKSDAVRKLRKKILEMRLIKEREIKENKLKQEEIQLKQEIEIQEENKKKAKEDKIIQKMNTENKIKEYKIKKKEEEAKKLEEEKEIQAKINEKKKKDREEFLKIAKKKLLENLAQKTEKKQKASFEEELSRKTTAEKKINQRKLLMKKISQSKQPILQEKNFKEQIYIALIDPGVKEVIGNYNPGIESVYNYYCKLAPVSSIDTSLMSLVGFNKFSTQFPIVPFLISSDEVLKIFKRITKRKSSESGINYKEFIEILISVALLSISKLQEDLAKKLETYDVLVKEFFEWISMPNEATKALDFIKKINQNNQTLNPRDKLRKKNTLIRNLSES